MFEPIDVMFEVLGCVGMCQVSAVYVVRHVV